MTARWFPPAACFRPAIGRTTPISRDIPSIAKAKELLTTAGYGDSNPLKFPFMGYTIRPRVQPRRRSSWHRDPGILEEGRRRSRNPDRRMDSVPDRPARRQIPGFAQWLEGDNGDPDNFLYSLLGQAERGWLEHELVRQPGCRELVRTGSEVTDQEQRKTLYHQAEQTIVDDAPWVFLGYQKHQVVARTNVQNLTLQPTYIYYLSKVTKS